MHLMDAARREVVQNGGTRAAPAAETTAGSWLPWTKNGT